MNIFGTLLEKIADSIPITFTWKNNKKKVVKQKGDVTVSQEAGSTSTVYHIENVNVLQVQELAGAEVVQDMQGIIEAAGKRFVLEQGVRQQNFKTTVEKANLPAISSPQTLEQDWFMKWMDVAQSTSREDVQDLLARILSGEVTSSSSFSIKTLDVIKNLGKRELDLFQKFCDISYYHQGFTGVIAEPYGQPNNNGLAPLGLSYLNLTELQDCGLIKADLTSVSYLPVPAVFQVPFQIGGTAFSSRTVIPAEVSERRTPFLNFTQTGLELRSVLKLGVNEEYNTKFLEWVNGICKLDLVSDPLS